MKRGGGFINECVRGAMYYFLYSELPSQYSPLKPVRLLILWLELRRLPQILLGLYFENKNHSTYFVVVVAAQLRITSGRLPRIWGSISHRALSALGTSHYTAFITSGAATAFIKAEPRDAREGEGDIIRCPRNVLYG